MINHLHLRFFRNHMDLKIETGGGRFVLISGQNGSGKTNILEAISLIAPGKGMRNAKLEDVLMFEQSISNAWAVEMHTSAHNNILIGAEYNQLLMRTKSMLRLNNDHIKPKALHATHKVLWLTPQNGHIFIATPAERRAFLDRMTFNIINTHATLFVEYEHYCSLRNKALQSSAQDDVFLSMVEHNIALRCAKIIQNRIDCVQLVKEHLCFAHAWMSPILILDGEIHKAFIEQVDFIEYFAKQLKINRYIDAKIKRMKLSASKIDFVAMHPIKNIIASLCSSGEQKSMLVSIIIAQIVAIKTTTNIAPIILLDDIFETLDQENAMNLIMALQSLSDIQTWITGVNITQIGNNIEALSHIIEL